MYNNYIYNCYAYGCRCRQGCASARASVRSGGRSRGDGVGETRAVPRTLLHTYNALLYVSRTRYAYDSHDARTPRPKQAATVPTRYTDPRRHGSERDGDRLDRGYGPHIPQNLEIELGILRS